MRPVEQTEFWAPAEGDAPEKRGNCVAACLASLFEVPIEDCAGVIYYNQLCEWTKERFPALSVDQVGVGDSWGQTRDPEAYLEWPTEHFCFGYWMATVWSPRVVDLVGDDGYMEWGLHAVVMRGSDLAWDPFPGADWSEEPMRFRSCTSWRVWDPGQL